MRILLSLLIITVAHATPTQIVDVLYQPNGNPPAVAALTDITITQTAFVSGNNYYPAFELSPHPVSDVNGNFSIWLEPNPTGQPYTILYRATNGIITHEFWTVPASLTPLKIKDVRTSVGPLPPLGIVQLSQLAQGGALLNNVIAWNGLAWVASPLGTLGLEVTANKDQASGYAGLTAGTLLKTAEFPAFTGDCTTSAGTVAINCTNAIARTGVDINTSSQVTATHLSSALPVNQGGTGDLTLAAHGTLIGAGTGAVAVGSPGTAGQVWTSNGPSADPTFQAGGGGSCGYLDMTCFQKTIVFAGQSLSTTAAIEWGQTTATCSGFGANSGSVAGEPYGVQFQGSGGVCFLYYPSGNLSSSYKIKDPLSGGSPRTWTATARYMRAFASGDHYVGWSSGVNTFTEFVGLRYNSGTGKWNCVIRASGADVASVDMAATPDFNIHTFSITNAATANSASCTIDGVGPSPTAGTIPANDWFFIEGTSASSTHFAAFETRLQVSGMSR